ncbi:MAG TPA: hypothetical protein VMU76_04905 [Acidimicrobiales bacterium]|nr:hypothetical protein [Acidimicrobiales bacterium]
MARQVEELLFVPGAPAVVLARMDLLAEAGDGWVNLVPVVEEPEGDEAGGADRPVPRLGFSAMFGGGPAPRVPMCTWVPPARGRRAAGVTVGIMHARGRRAVQQLGELGVGLPVSWRVQQDHQRRGLVVRAAPETEHAEVLGWACRAGSALCLGAATGEWRAIVHLPTAGQRGEVARE